MNERIRNFFFLCQCLQPQQDADSVNAIRAAILQESIQWEYVIESANLALVSPALWTAFVHKGLRDILPTDVAQYLEELHRLNQARNDAIRRQITEITEALNGIGVEPLLLKGAALLFTDALADPASRMMIDIDLMVRSEDLSQALETLFDLQYRHPEFDSTEFQHAAHEPPLCRTGYPASVEVHTRLFHGYNDPEVITAAQAWQDSIRVSRDGHAARILSHSDALIFNILHAQVHHEHFDFGRLSLRGLLDFVLMARSCASSLDWHTLHARLAQRGLAREGESYVYAAFRLLGNPVPPGFPSGLGTRLHHARCLFVVGWPKAQTLIPIGTSLRLCRLFSAERMEKRFGCSRSGWDLARTRVAYFSYLVREFVFGKKRQLLRSRLQGTRMEAGDKPRDT